MQSIIVTALLAALSFSLVCVWIVAGTINLDLYGSNDNTRRMPLLSSIPRSTGRNTSGSGNKKRKDRVAQSDFWTARQSSSIHFEDVAERINETLSPFNGCRRTPRISSRRRIAILTFCHDSDCNGYYEDSVCNKVSVSQIAWLVFEKAST